MQRSIFSPYTETGRTQIFLVHSESQERFLGQYLLQKIILTLFSKSGLWYQGR